MNSLSDFQLEQLLTWRAEGTSEAEVLRRFPSRQRDEVRVYLSLLGALDAEKISLDPGKKEAERIWSRVLSRGETSGSKRRELSEGVEPQDKNFLSRWRGLKTVEQWRWIPVAMAGILLVVFVGSRLFGESGMEVATEYRSISIPKTETTITDPDGTQAVVSDRVIETIVSETDDEGILLAEEDIDAEIPAESETVLKDFDETYDETLL